MEDDEHSHSMVDSNMKINSELGFYPTTFSEMPKHENFWKGCEMCVNHDILKRAGRRFCLCTAMRFDPQAKSTHSFAAPHNRELLYA